MTHGWVPMMRSRRSSTLQKERNIGQMKWIAYTRCGDDLVGHNDMAPQDWQDVEPAPEGSCLHSANGPVCVNELISSQCLTAREVIYDLVMKDSPAVLNIGRRCYLEGWAFYWVAYHVPYVTPTQR